MPIDHSDSPPINISLCLTPRQAADLTVVAGYLRITISAAVALLAAAALTSLNSYSMLLESSEKQS